MYKYLKLLIYLSPALIILIGAILFFNHFQKFDIVGDDLIKFGNFEEQIIGNSTTISFLNKWTGWNENIKWKENDGFNKTAGILLKSEKNIKCNLKFFLLDIDQYFPLHLLFKINAKSHNIIKGKKSWNVARIDIIFKDLNKKIIKDIKHNVVSLTGSSAWKEYKMVFSIPKSAKSAGIFFRNISLSGTLYVDDLSLQPVILKQSYKHWQFLIGSFFFQIFIFYLWETRIYKRKYWSVLLITVLLIIIFVAMPEDLLSRITDGLFKITDIRENQITALKNPQIFDVINTGTKGSNLSVSSAIFENSYNNVEDILFFLFNNIKTFGHFILFALLSWISCLSFLKESIYKNYSESKKEGMVFRYFSILIYLVVFSIYTEVIQYFTPSRFPKIDDLGVDLLGIILGIFSYFLYNYYKKKIG